MYVHVNTSSRHVAHTYLICFVRWHQIALDSLKWRRTQCYLNTVSGCAGRGDCCTLFMSTEDMLQLYSCPLSVLMARVSSAGLMHMVSISWHSAGVSSLLYESGGIWRKKKIHMMTLKHTQRLQYHCYLSNHSPVSLCFFYNCPPRSFQKDRLCRTPKSKQSLWSRTEWLWCEAHWDLHPRQRLWSSSFQLACEVDQWNSQHGDLGKTNRCTKSMCFICFK